MITIDSHGRTALKTVVYRVLCTIAIYFIAVALGAESAASGTLALTIVVLGTILYYLHDRVWNLIRWRRDNEGKESALRSVIKTLAYRLLTVVIAVILARLIITDSNQMAISFAVSQFVVNMLLYYLVERVFNRIQLGLRHGE